MHGLLVVGSRGPRLVPHRALVRDPRPRAGTRAVTAAHQRGQQAWPLRPVMPGLARGGWPPGHRWTDRLAGTARRPGGIDGWPAVTDGAALLIDRTGFLTDGTGIVRVNPPRRYRAVTLARCAHESAQIVLRPASGDRPGSVVRLPERGRVRESGLAPCHGTPGGRNPDLVADDTVPGNHNRMNQRIEARRIPRGFAVTVSQGADGPSLSHPASPAGLARLHGVPGETS
jgi:hypothetical protein